MNGNHSTSQISIGYTLESCFFNHAGELGLLRELSDALDKVLVGLTVVSQKLSHRWNNIERVEIVDLFQAWYLDFGEL